MKSVKANMTQEMNLDTVTRRLRLAEIIDRYNVKFHGHFRQVIVDLIAMRIPLPGIYVVEDHDGVYHAVGRYANDFLTSIEAYVSSNTDERHLVRRAMETPVELIIIRCTNSKEKIKNLFSVLKSIGAFSSSNEDLQNLEN